MVRVEKENVDFIGNAIGNANKDLETIKTSKVIAGTFGNMYIQIKYYIILIQEDLVGLLQQQVFPEMIKGIKKSTPVLKDLLNSQSRSLACEILLT